MIIIIGAVARWLDMHAAGNKYWLSICNLGMGKARFPMLFHIQVHNMSISLLLEIQKF